MNFATYTNGTGPDALTLQQIRDVAQQLVGALPKEYMLICPDGRVFKGPDPWKLVMATGYVPQILRIPLDFSTNERTT